MLGRALAAAARVRIDGRARARRREEAGVRGLTVSHTNSWRDPDPDRDPAIPTVSDHAATRIGQEVSDRAGLGPTQILALATLQGLEHEDQTASADAARQPVQTEAAERDVPASSGFDDPQRRDQLRTRWGRGRSGGRNRGAHPRRRRPRPRVRRSRRHRGSDPGRTAACPRP